MLPVLKRELFLQSKVHPVYFTEEDKHFFPSAFHSLYHLPAPEPQIASALFAIDEQCKSQLLAHNATNNSAEANNLVC